MPELTRRRSTDAREECWHVYYGDVLAGTIAIGSGNPHDEDPWEWHCGFYPGSHPGEHQDGTAATFDEARAGFERHGPYFYRNVPKPISRRGAINRHGRPRNITASIAASLCRQTGSRHALRRVNLRKVGNDRSTIPSPCPAVASSSP